MSLLFVRFSNTSIYPILLACWADGDVKDISTSICTLADVKKVFAYCEFCYWYIGTLSVTYLNQC